MFRGKQHKNKLDSSRWPEGKAERLIERGIIEEDPDFKDSKSKKQPEKPAEETEKPKQPNKQRTAGKKK